MADMRMRLWMVVLAALTVGCDEHSRDPDRDESLGGKVPEPAAQAPGEKPVHEGPSM